MRPLLINITKILFIFTFILKYQIEAKDIWIQSVGIHSENHMNHNDFYAHSANFVEACHKNVTRQCNAFMNPELKYANDPDFLMRNNAMPRMEVKVPTRDSVLAMFEQAVLTAKPEDKILLALHNHGSPGSLEEGPSCISVNQSQKICTQDLEKIIAKKKKGTKIAIICDGCFSGGCVNLSRPDVCTAMTADQYFVGHATWMDGFLYRPGKPSEKVPTKIPREDVGIFGNLVQGNANSFADLKRKNVFFGSETMIRHRCDNKINKIISKFKYKELIAFLNLHKNLFQASLGVSEGDCSSSSVKIRYVYQVDEAFRNESGQAILNLICAEQKDEFDVQICNEFKKLVNDGKEVAQKYAEYMRTLTWVSIYKEEIDRAFAEIQNLSFAEAAAVHQEVIRIKEDKAKDAENKKESSVPGKIKAYAVALKRAYDRYFSSSQKARELDELLKKQFATRNKGSEIFFENCLLASLRMGRDGYFVAADRYEASILPKRDFTAKQIKEAQECEKSFTL